MLSLLSCTAVDYLIGSNHYHYHFHHPSTRSRTSVVSEISASINYFPAPVLLSASFPPSLSFILLSFALSWPGFLPCPHLQLNGGPWLFIFTFSPLGKGRKKKGQQVERLWDKLLFWSHDVSLTHRHAENIDLSDEQHLGIAFGCGCLCVSLGAGSSRAYTFRSFLAMFGFVP